MMLPFIQRALRTGEIIESKEVEYFSVVYTETESNLSKPFASTDINRFLALLDHCSGNDDSVNVDSLRVVFGESPDWADLTDETSLLFRMLTSPLLRRFPDTSGDDRIDKDYLALFGLLHCTGNPTDKAFALYRIILKCGLVKRPWISATTRNWTVVFEKLCKLSSYNIVYFTHHYTELVPITD